MFHIDSWLEPWPPLTDAALATENIRIGLSASDVARRTPDVLAQLALTLDQYSKGGFFLALGAGENKQCTPYGVERDKPFGRLEEVLKLLKLWFGTDEPVDYDGKFWKVEQGGISAPAYTEGGPELLVTGGPGKAMRFAAQLADGWVTYFPGSTAEEYAGEVQEFNRLAEEAGKDPEPMTRLRELLRGGLAAEPDATLRESLESKDRDLAEFTFGFWPFVVVYESEDERERLLENDLVKWMAAIFGRLHHGDWAKEGVELILPEDWHYAMKLNPHSMSCEEVDDIVAKVPREMVEKSCFIGTAAEVAAQLRPYAEAGANFMAPVDLAPAVLTPEEQPQAWERVIELCGHLKGA